MEPCYAVFINMYIISADTCAPLVVKHRKGRSELLVRILAMGPAIPLIYPSLVFFLNSSPITSSQLALKKLEISDRVYLAHFPRC